MPSPKLRMVVESKKYLSFRRCIITPLAHHLTRVIGSLGYKCVTVVISPYLDKVITPLTTARVPPCAKQTCFLFSEPQEVPLMEQKPVNNGIELLFKSSIPSINSMIHFHLSSPDWFEMKNGILILAYSIIRRPMVMAHYVPPSINKRVEFQSFSIPFFSRRNNPSFAGGVHWCADHSRCANRLWVDATLSGCWLVITKSVITFFRQQKKSTFTNHHPWLHSIEERITRITG